MAYSYLSKSYHCDLCSTAIDSSCEYSVDHPIDNDVYDEYCKRCYTELGGMYWTGDWTADKRNPIVLDNKGNKLVKECML